MIGEGTAGTAISLGKVALGLGKGHAAYAVTTTSVLVPFLGAAVLVAFGGSVLLVGMLKFESLVKSSRSDSSQNEDKSEAK